MVRWGIGDFIAIYVAGLLASVVGFSIGISITGDTTNHYSGLTYALGFLGQYGAWGAGLVYASRRKGLGALAADFGVRLEVGRMWALVAGVALQFLLGALVLPLVHLVNDQKQQLVDDLRNASGPKLTVLIIAAALVAPVMEEILFRGLLLRALRRHFDPQWAVAISAAVFAGAHLTDASLGTLAIVPALFALGLISGVAAVRLGDLSVSIPLHIGFNLVTVAAYAFVAGRL
jgi:membrane protease YdiL (CAAX protease family)